MIRKVFIEKMSDLSNKKRIKRNDRMDFNRDTRCFGFLYFEI